MSYIGYIVKDSENKTLFVNGIRKNWSFFGNWIFDLTYPEYYRGIDFDPEYLNMSKSETKELALQIQKTFKNTPFEIVAFYGLISATEMEEIYTGENLPMIKEN